MYDNGGCVSMGLGGTLNLEGVTFTNCSCVVEQNNQSGEVAFSGGALYLEDYICLSMVDTNFIGNMALYDGGAVYKKNNCDGAVSTLIRNCTFAHNIAFGPQVPAITDRPTGGGGAIFSTSDLQICSSVFSNNSANFGGALRTGKADVFIESSTFVNNMALDVGTLAALSSFHFPAKLTIIDDGGCPGGSRRGTVPGWGQHGPNRGTSRGHPAQPVPQQHRVFESVHSNRHLGLPLPVPE